MKQALCITLLGLSLAGCGVIKATEAIPNKMDGMTKGMQHTSDAVDNQTKAVALNGLLNPDNSAELTPVPTRMIPYGKVLGENLSAQELAEFTSLGLSEINEVFPDKKADANGNEIPYTADEIAKINHDKAARLIGMQIVAGFAPQATIDQLVNEQIYNAGEYESTAYTILMLRVQFIRDIRLDAQLLSAPLTNAGEIADAVNWNTKVDAIAKLAFADRIQMKTTGFIPAENSPAEKLDPSVALNYWKKIQTSAERDFNVSAKVLTGQQAQDQGLFQQQKDSFNQSMQLVNTFISSWQVPAKR